MSPSYECEITSWPRCAPSSDPAYFRARAHIYVDMRPRSTTRRRAARLPMVRLSYSAPFRQAVQFPPATDSILPVHLPAVPASSTATLRMDAANVSLRHSFLNVRTRVYQLIGLHGEDYLAAHAHTAQSHHHAEAPAEVELARIQQMAQV